MGIFIHFYLYMQFIFLNNKTWEPTMAINVVHFFLCFFFCSFVSFACLIREYIYISIWIICYFFGFSVRLPTIFPICINHWFLLHFHTKPTTKSNAHKNGLVLHSRQIHIFVFMLFAIHSRPFVRPSGVRRWFQFAKRNMAQLACRIYFFPRILRT